LHIRGARAQATVTLPIRGARAQATVKLPIRGARAQATVTFCLVRAVLPVFRTIRNQSVLNHTLTSIE